MSYALMLLCFIPWCFLPLCFFVLVPRVFSLHTLTLYCFSLSVFNLQWGKLPGWVLSLVWLQGVLSHGQFWPGWLEGSAPWCGASCLPRLGQSLWRRSLRPWTGISPSVVGPPKVASSVPQVLLPSHVSVVTASVCVGVSVCVCMSVCLCAYVWVCMYLRMFLHMTVGVGGLGSFNFLLLFLFDASLFLLSVHFCKALWDTFLYEKRHINKSFNWFPEKVCILFDMFGIWKHIWYFYH